MFEQVLQAFALGYGGGVAFVVIATYLRIKGRR